MNILLKLLALLLTIGVSAQQSLKQTQYAAYLTTSKMMWEKSTKLAAKEHGEESFEKALALYGLLNNTMASKDEETFKKYKDETIELLEKLIEENPNWGEPKAVLSSTYGLVMAYSPMRGMFLGMKSNSLITEALNLQPESALVQKLYSGSKLYTPEMFGGDPEEAVESFSIAIDLFAKNDETTENWFYLDTMMGLSMAYLKTGQKAKAKDILEKAIALEPNYYWAISELTKMDKS
ncbi:MAG: tetratricopeptide repeat protein [Bacteroidota bacterium]